MYSSPVRSNCSACASSLCASAPQQQHKLVSTRALYTTYSENVTRTVKSCEEGASTRRQMVLAVPSSPPPANRARLRPPTGGVEELFLSTKHIYTRHPPFLVSSNRGTTRMSMPRTQDQALMMPHDVARGYYKLCFLRNTCQTPGMKIRQ